MPKITNLRKKHLDAICKKISFFIVSETYTDEAELQKKLSDAIKLIDEVSEACVSNDDKAAATK